MGTNTLNITAPDKSVLSWVNLGSGTDTIAVGDTLTYTLPTAAGSVLNLVTGASGTTIDGSIVSNGNVFLMNKNGIIFGSTAMINAGGFYASAIDEPLAATYFQQTGTLGFNGPTGSAVTVNPTSATGGAATLQAVGTGNKIWLAGQSVTVNAGTFYGNLTVKTLGGAAGTAKLAQDGAVAINKVNGAGGDLSIITNGGAVELTGAGLSALVPSLLVSAPGAVPTLGYVAPDGIIAKTDATGVVTSVALADGGTATGYARNSTITVTVPGGTTAATVTATTDAFGKIIKNGFTVVSGGTGYAASSILPATVPPPTPTGAPYGTGYAPNAQIALTILPPYVQQGTVTNQVNVGTAATGYAQTNAKGEITGFVLTSNGSGYTANATTTTNTSFNNNFAAASAFTTTVAGNLSVNTSSAALNGAIAQRDGANTLTVAGTTTLTTALAGSSIAAGDINLPGVDFTTLNLPLVGTTSVNDVLGGMAIGNSKIVPNATAALALSTEYNSSTAGNLSMASNAKVEVVPTAAIPTPTISLVSGHQSSITFTGIGAMTIGTLTSSTQSNTSTINGNSDITLPNFGGRNLVVTTTGGAVTTGNLSKTDGAFTVTATGNITVGNFNTNGAVKLNSSAGTLTAGIGATVANVVASGSEFKSAGDLTLGSLSTSGTATIASSSGSVTITNGFSGGGSITAATDINIGTTTSAKGSATSSAAFSAVTNGSGVLNSGTLTNVGGGYAPNSTVALAFAAPPALPATNVRATGYATTNSSGQLSGIVITNSGQGYTSNPSYSTFPTPTNAVVTGGALSLTATNGTVNITGPIVASSTSSLDIKSGQSLALPSVTAQTLTLTSTGGSISHSAAANTVVSTGSTKIDAAADVLLDNVANDFGTVTLLNSPNGIVLKDGNTITVGTGTITKGNVTITSGTQLASVANGAALTVPSPVPVVAGATLLAGAALATTNTTSGVVTGVGSIVGGGGYASSVTSSGTIPVTFSAPPTNATPSPITTASAATVVGTSTTNYTTGYMLTATNVLSGVVLSAPVGNGYQPNTEVPVTINEAGVPAAGYTAVGIVNANGQIGSVQVRTYGAALVTPSVTFAAPTLVTAPATGYATTNANGAINGVVITDAGNGYFGSYVPRATIAAAPVNVAANRPTVTAIAVGGAVTGVTVAAPVTPLVVAPNYGTTAPTLTLAGSAGLTFTSTLTSGTLALGTTAVTPNATGGIFLGSTGADSIKIGGNLLVGTAGPAGTVTSTLLKYSEISTKANNVFVVGSVTMNTLGADATLGLTPPLGGSTALYFGQVNGNVGAGTLSAFENTTLNLGTITAGKVAATSIGADIVNSGAITTTGNVDVSANSFFNPGTVTLETTNNNIAGTINILNANTVSVKSNANTTIASVPSATGRGAVGNVNGVVGSGKSLTFNGDLTSVSFTSSGSSLVTVNDPSGITVTNAKNSGANGKVVINAAGPIVLGSGIALASTGAGASTTFTSTGTSAAITDSAPGVMVSGAVSFISDNGIAIGQTGHSFGTVTLQSGGATATSANIAFVESGTLNLKSLTVKDSPANVAGSVVLTSTTGDIIQTPLVGTISVPTATLAVSVAGAAALAQSVSLTAAGGVNLSNPATTNVIGTVGLANVPVILSASTDSSVVQRAQLVLGDVAVRAGKFAANTVGVAGAGIYQNTGSKIIAYADTSFNTQGGIISVANSGNGFGGLTLNSVNTALAGADVSLTESSTARLVSVDTGTAGKLTVVSETGSIVGGVSKVGGVASLTALTGINLTDLNAFGGGLFLSTPASATVQNTVGTTLTMVGTAGSNVGGSLTLRNTAGNISDGGLGNVKVTGALFLDVGAGNISITGSGNTFGALQFRGNAVTIVEDTTLNLAGGSVANGNAMLSSGGDIQMSAVGTTVFSGTSVFNGTLSLFSTGKITLGNSLFVAQGLTFRAIGAVDLSALSLSGNLNGRAYTNLGAASVKDPTP